LHDTNRSETIHSAWLNHYVVFGAVFRQTRALCSVYMQTVLQFYVSYFNFKVTFCTHI